MSDQQMEQELARIQSLSVTTSPNMRPDAILTRCKYMRDAIEEIEKIARARQAGEQ